MHSELKKFVNYLACASCGEAALVVEDDTLVCRSCRTSFASRDGIAMCCDKETEAIGFLDQVSAVDLNDHSALEITKANAVYHNLAGTEYEHDQHSIGTITQVSDSRVKEAFRFVRDAGIVGPFLDFGTGTGHMLELAADIYEPRLGIDVSSGMLKVAFRKGLPVMLANCLKPPVKSGSMGVVSSYSLLHHFKDPKEVLSQMLRVLRPGGWLVVDWEPNTHGRPRALAKAVAWLKHPGLWFTSKAYDAPELHDVNQLAEYHEAMGNGLDGEDLAAFLTANGCDDVRVLYHSNGPSSVRPMLRIKDRIRALLDGRMPSDRNSASYFMILARRGAMSSQWQ